MFVIFGTDFRDEFLSALPKPEQSPKIGMFIDSCFAHCQSGAQDSWNADGSPSIQKMVRLAVLKLAQQFSDDSVSNNFKSREIQ